MDAILDVLDALMDGGWDGSCGRCVHPSQGWTSTTRARGGRWAGLDLPPIRNRWGWIERTCGGGPVLRVWAVLALAGVRSAG